MNAKDNMHETLLALFPIALETEYVPSQNILEHGFLLDLKAVIHC